MKKLIPLIILAAVAIGAWYLSAVKPTEESPVAGSNSAATSASRSTLAGGGDSGAIPAEGEDLEEGDEEAPVEIPPAAKAFKSADEALAAIKKAATEYDDTVLEQFTEPGEDCSFCPEVYSSVRELMLQPGTPSDQVSFYGELLAISGRVENIKALVEGLKNPPSQETADALAQSLELTIGKDPIVTYLSEQLSTQNEKLRESSVAAITNQGSRLAAEALYSHIVERGDPNGYYNLGIGLGELVPEESAMPYLQQQMTKQDQYSHLAVKALLNGGTDGLKMVMDGLATSNPETAASMLKDAVDHVNYETTSEDYLKQLVANSKNQAQLDFANKILEAFKAEEAAAAEDEAAEAQ